MAAVLIYNNMSVLCANHVDSLLSVKGPFPIKLFSHPDSTGPSPLDCSVEDWSLIEPLRPTASKPLIKEEEKEGKYIR